MLYCPERSCRLRALLTSFKVVWHQGDYIFHKKEVLPIPPQVGYGLKLMVGTLVVRFEIREVRLFSKNNARDYLRRYLLTNTS